MTIPKIRDAEVKQINASLISIEKALDQIAKEIKDLKERVTTLEGN